MHDDLSAVYPTSHLCVVLRFLIFPAVFKRSIWFLENELLPESSRIIWQICFRSVSMITIILDLVSVVNYFTTI